MRRAYVKLSGYMNRTEKEKVSLLTLALSAEGLRLCSSRPGPKDTMDQMLVGLETLYTPVTSVTKEGVALWDKKQVQDDIEEFATRLRVKALYVSSSHWKTKSSETT